MLSLSFVHIAFFPAYAEETWYENEMAPLHFSTVVLGFSDLQKDSAYANTEGYKGQS